MNMKKMQTLKWSVYHNFSCYETQKAIKMLIVIVLRYFLYFLKFNILLL